MKNNNQINELVIQGLCMNCFFLNYEEETEYFMCAKYDINPDGIVKGCPGLLPISEGLDQLIAKMKEENELPAWVGQWNSTNLKNMY